MLRAFEGIVDWLDQRSASFETAAARLPQDEEFFLNAISEVPHAEERPTGRSSKHSPRSLMRPLPDKSCKGAETYCRDPTVEFATPVA